MHQLLLFYTFLFSIIVELALRATQEAAHQVGKCAHAEGLVRELKRALALEREQHTRLVVAAASTHRKGSLVEKNVM